MEHVIGTAIAPLTDALILLVRVLACVALIVTASLLGIWYELYCLRTDKEPLMAYLKWKRRQAAVQRETL